MMADVQAAIRILAEGRQRASARHPWPDHVPPDHDWSSTEGYVRIAVRRTRKRQLTLVSVAKQAAKAGIPVARYEVKPDGTIGIVVGKPGEANVDLDDAPPIDRSEWN